MENICLFVMCDVSGTDVGDCSKNGKKAAEAMSLSKEGKSAHFNLPHITLLLFGTSENNNINSWSSCECACINVHVH